MLTATAACHSSNCWRILVILDMACMPGVMDAALSMALSASVTALEFLFVIGHGCYARRHGLFNSLCLCAHGLGPDRTLMKNNF